ncbi:MAG: diguanylate cyclase [Magnetococcales bacterium]|nr:diguanylate cyclase [Magnetococcales bacterium]
MAQVGLTVHTYTMKRFLLHVGLGLLLVTLGDAVLVHLEIDPFAHLSDQWLRQKMDRHWGNLFLLSILVGLGYLIYLSGHFRRLAMRLDEQSSTLETLHHRTELILNAAAEGIYGVDQYGNTTFVNQAAIRMTGWTRDDLIGHHQHEILHHSHRDGSPYPKEECQIYASIHTGKPRQTDRDCFWRKDGSSFPVDYTSSPIMENGVPTGAVVVFRDISRRREEERRELRSQASRLAITALLETGLEPLTLSRQLEVALDIVLSVSWLAVEYKGSIFLVDPQTGDLVIASQRGLHRHLLTACARIPPGYCLCGRAAETRELVFANALDHRHDVTFQGISEHGHYCIPLLSNQRLLGVLNLYVPHNHQQTSEEVAFLSTIAITLAGIIERRQMEQRLREAEEKLRFMAHHDPLTGLPNRVLFLELLERTLARAQREQKTLAVLFMDLDRFKQVNDSLGHDIGDMLLREVSRRIRSCLRDADTLARLGGDEFVLLLSVVTDGDAVALVARKIIDALNEPFELKGNTCRIGSSVGAALFPKSGHTPEELVKRADMAMYAVKKRGRNDFQMYEEGMEERMDNAS